MHESHHLSLMDAAFHLDEVARSNFIQMVLQSLGSSYACLWSFSAPSSSFFYLDGLFWDSGDVQSNAFFNNYKQSFFAIQQSVPEKFVRSHSQVPGLAFRNNMPFIELREDQLLILASNDSQRKFYQEARIKIVIFMGCTNGEIELGFSNVPQSDLKMVLTSLFPEDFLRNLQILAENPNSNPPSSSSSSLRSLSMDSPEYSSLLFRLPAATSSSCQPLLLTPTTTNTTMTAANFPSQLAQFPIAESEHAAMTSAFLANMTSPSLSSTSHHPQQQQQRPQQQQPPRQNPRPSAFARYVALTQFKPCSSRRISMLKRAIAYCRSMNLIRIHERIQGADAGGSSSSNRPISVTQMHHMMSERKRREKLNKSFQSLKALLPPGTKKDKASVLSATREFLSSLKSQVKDLRWKNAILEAQSLPPPTKESAAEETTSPSSAPNQSRSRVEVSTTTVSNPASTSSQVRVVDLRVIVRRYTETPDLVIQILEFLKQTRNINVLSLESDARVMLQDGVANHVSLRLHVEGDEWDESAFQEAVRRLVADLAQ